MRKIILASASPRRKELLERAGVCLLYTSQTETATDAEKELLAQAQEFVKKFEEAMDDDFNTADALAAIFELVKFCLLYTSVPESFGQVS